MNNIELVTKYNTGLIDNFKLLKKSKLYKTEHNGSYFKYIYDKLESGFELDQAVSSILLYETNSYTVIGVLLFFHNVSNAQQDFTINNYVYLNAGTIGIYIKPEYRGKGYSKKLLKEFENNFIRFYSYRYDYIIINTLEAAYYICKKYFSWFIPSQKQNCSFQNNIYIQEAISNHKKTLKYYRQ